MACWDFPPTGGDDKCTGVGDARKCTLRDLSTSTFATDARLGLQANAALEQLEGGIYDQTEPHVRRESARAEVTQ